MSEDYPIQPAVSTAIALQRPLTSINTVAFYFMMSYSSDALKG